MDNHSVEKHEHSLRQEYNLATAAMKKCED